MIYRGYLGNFFFVCLHEKLFSYNIQLSILPVDSFSLIMNI